MTTRYIFIYFLVFAVAFGTAQSAVGATYKLDPAHSSVVFKAKHFDIGWIYGMFLNSSGTIQYEPDAPEQTQIDLTIKANSLFTNVKKRDSHLKGPDFFNSKQHPNIEFSSKSVTPVNDDTLRVAGTLSMRGTSKTVTTDVELTGAGEGPNGKFRRGFRTTIVINRLDYGVDYMPDALSKEIPVTVTGEVTGQ